MAAVAGYQLLKHAWIRGSVGTAPLTPCVYLLSDDYAHAAIVHRRLRKAAQEFLKTDLALAGAGPVRTRVRGGRGGSSQEPIRVLSIATDGARAGGGGAGGGAGAGVEETLGRQCWMNYARCRNPMNREQTMRWRRRWIMWRTTRQTW